MNRNKILNQIVKIRKLAEEKTVKLFQENIINEDLLFRATGIKQSDNKKTGLKVFKKITGMQAKYFSNMDMGYVYPLLKTHKLHPDIIQQCQPGDIPVRLVQSAGQTFLSRITSIYAKRNYKSN